MERKELLDLRNLDDIGKVPYNEADEDVKITWHFLVKEILPRICLNWKRKRVQKTTPMSQVIAVSDETYMVCVLKRYWKIWKEEVENKEAEPTGRRKGKTAVTPEYYATQYMIVKGL